MAAADSLEGRVVLITGANTGIGLVTARELVRRGARVFVACRSPRKSAEAMASIAAATGKKPELLPLDLGDFGSVRACAKAFLDTGLPLHVLINNAGLAGQRGLTASGFELAFGVNHLGHFLLTQLLLDRIVKSGPARVVTVASRAHYRCKRIAWEELQKPTRTRTALPEYQRSKLANVLFSAELARRMSGTQVTTYSLHPGVVATDVWRSVPWPVRPLMKLTMISSEQGAATTLHCATAPALANESGLYYDTCRQKEPSALAHDCALAAELWQRSEAWTR